MTVIIGDTYEEMSEKAVDHLLDLIQFKKNAVLCTASGDSPAALYKDLVEAITHSSIDISCWSFISLDEWAGINGNDEGSCRFHLNNQLFNPLNIAENKIAFFDGKATDLEAECERIDKCITQQGGIDVAIVGLGLNGHVGMNEPGTSPELYSHVADIDSTTQQVGQKYFKKEQQLTHGLTLGLASLMEARNIILVVSGSKKAEIARRVLEEEISGQLPASLLRRHENFFVFLDKEAADQLKDKDK